MTVMDLDKPGAQPPSPGPKSDDGKCDDFFLQPAFDSELLLGRVLAGMFVFLASGFACRYRLLLFMFTFT